MIRNALVVAAIVPFVAACAGPGFTMVGGGIRTPVDKCDGQGQCFVVVSVPFLCTATANPVDLLVKPRPAKIFWDLDNDAQKNYRFRPKAGVTFKDSHPDFTDPQSQANDKKYKWDDANSVKMQHKYSIWLERKAEFGDTWLPCNEYDPVIYNEG